MNTEKTDEEIALTVQGGDDGSFDMLADRYREKLGRYALRYVGSADAASDVIQEVFIKAHQKISTFDPERKFSPWIYRITHNESVNYLKRNSKIKTVSLDDTLSLSDEKSTADVELSSLDAWFERELREQMADAIGRLPDTQAEVIHLRYIEGFSYKEISEIISKPVNTVGTLVSRAKKNLLKVLLEQEN